MKIHISGDNLSKGLPVGNGGLYRATITGRKVSTASTGNPRMSLEFTIQSQGPNPNVNTIGKTVYGNYIFTEDSLWIANILYSVVTGSNIPEADYTPDEFFNLLWNVAQNKSVMIEVTDKEYQGVTRSNITKVMAISG